MTPILQGRILFIAALGLMASLVSGDVSQMTTWAEVFRPAFVGSVLAHFGVVVAAYVGGRLIPTKGEGSG